MPLSLTLLQLSEFVPFLQEICFVHDNMTRRRASQVLANFVDSRVAVGRLRRICMQLRVMLHLEEKVSDQAETQTITLCHGFMGVF